MRLSLSRAALAGALLVSTVGVSACETDPYGPYVPAYAAGVPTHVGQARVVSFRPVTLGASGDTVGASTVAGAVGGGLIGAAAAPRWSSGGYGLLGAVAGGLIGNAVARNAGTRPGFAYVIRRRDGETMELVQPGRYPIPVGTPVFVNFGPRVTITPASSYGPPPPPPPPPGA